MGGVSRLTGDRWCFQAESRVLDQGIDGVSRLRAVLDKGMDGVSKLTAGPDKERN